MNRKPQAVPCSTKTTSFASIIIHFRLWPSRQPDHLAGIGEAGAESEQQRKAT
jgi:hypothetical protein